MGKTSKWLRSILTGKKDKDKGSKATNQNSSNDAEDRTAPISTTPPKEKRRWSFRRSSATSNPTASAESNAVAANPPTDAENEQMKKHAMTVAAATAAAADAAVAAAQAAAAVIRLTAPGSNGSATSVEEAAAIKIQSVFRSYLARKALCALRGLVKLQALVRGHLVRKQATATLRCMQALVTAQARARAQRIRMASSEEKPNQRHSSHRNTTHDNFFRHIYDEVDMNLEENIKIVEMDVCETKCDSRRRNSNSNSRNNTNHPHHAYYSPITSYSKEEAHRASSPSPSALTEMSPRAYSGHFEVCTSFSTAQSSPQYYYSAISRPDDSKNHPSVFPKPPYAEAESVVSYDYPLFPNYMANTQSSRAKARSQSAPKQRPADSFERQPSRRRASVEGRNVPRPVRMQRSASHVGASAQNYQYPWSIKLDKSSVSLKDSECGSTSTVLTNTNYCRSLVAYDTHGQRYY